MLELLSPAGSYEGFLAAIASGADAVYAGGSSFGARAYAQNFTNEEFLRAIDVAHIHNKSLYMTVNTLCKEREFDELRRFLTPFYNQGLDGVIVQDIGVISMLRQEFPHLPVHASTQMTLTGIEGAKYLRELGATRIVPARELSLEEIKNIHDNTDIEIECFIHGAMCYSYSGQCLFSGYLGGRSGNRGRCAQPCRQPYQVYSDGQRVNSESEEYVLSMKDLCTIRLLPDLIEAGICSFKIEGRMKKPEYTGFVTSMYRKYIDMYLEKGRSGYKVADRDFEALTSAYKRCEPETGYYDKYNGRTLITLKKPSYESALEGCETIKELSAVKLYGYGYFHEGESAVLTASAGDISVSVSHGQCQRAAKRPMTEADIRKQLLKTGGTGYEFSELIIDAEDNIFIPNSILNELRRKAIDEIEQELLKDYRRDHTADMIASPDADSTTNKGASNYESSYTVLCESIEQLLAALMDKYCGKLNRIYIESSLLLNNKETVVSLLDIYINNDTDTPEIYLAMPYILREEDKNKLKPFLLNKEIMQHFKGVLIRNYESLYLINELKGNEGITNSLNIITDFNLYSFNTMACSRLIKSGARELTIPLELNIHEIRERGYLECSELLYYGYIPMMLSAGCVSKTMKLCRPNKQEHTVLLKDRYSTDFKVIRDCTFDLNRILNSVPVFLESEEADIHKLKPAYLRIQFTTESKPMCEALLDHILLNKPMENIDFTKGHFRKSVQ